MKVGDEEYLLRDPSPNPDSYPTVLSYADREGRLTIELQIKKGEISLRVGGKNPEAQKKKATVTSVEIVPAKRLKGLSAQPVILRIQHP